MTQSRNPRANRPAESGQRRPLRTSAEAEQAYRTAMSHVKLPETVRTSVLDETRRRAQSTETQRAFAGAERAERAHNASSPRETNARRRPRRWMAVAACLALACGIGGIALASMPLIGQNPDSVPEGAPDARQGSNYFALYAYADEGLEGTTAQTVALSFSDFGTNGGSGSEMNPTTDEPDRSGAWWMYLKFDFCPLCTGENIETITYEIADEDICFYWHSNEQFISAHSPNGSDGSAAQEGWIEYRDTSFVIDYADQSLLSRDIRCDIVVPVQVEGELASLHESLLNGSTEASNRFWAKAFTEAAQKLAQSPLTLTATFADGSIQTKTYTIAPVENFEQQLYDFYMADIAAYEETGESIIDEEPSLFTLTEVSE